ncbi:MAG: ABC transporter substrate-binding protein, partial [Gemmatimonadota bacterium]|nr:ABC transporter substrate-binding protein [Gemmatimonadota bacterium]
PHDSARAREILASKGWRDTDGDGVLDRNGVPFRFTLILNTGNPRKADAAQIIQQQWRRIGVDARIQLMEFNTFWDRQMNRTFQASFGNWGVGLSPDLSEVWGPDTPLNFVSFNDPEVTALMQRAQAQPTEALANPLWKQAAQRIVDAQPYTWLYFFDQVDGVNQRLRGMKIDTFGAYQNPWEWWIPTAEQTANPALVKDSATGSADTTTTP